MMEGLVVSLDPDLATLNRLWVVAEIAEAVKAKPIQFRAVHGLSQDLGVHGAYPFLGQNWSSGL